MAPKTTKTTERFTSEDLHRALFEVPPEPRTVEEMDEGIRRSFESRAGEFKNQGVEEGRARGGVRLMIDPKDLASAVKELRGRRTQRAVAKRAGIDPATWNAYEKGNRNPRRPERLRQMADGLGVDVLVLHNAILRQSALRKEKGPPLVQPTKDAGETRARVKPRIERIVHELVELVVELVAPAWLPNSGGPHEPNADDDLRETRTNPRS